MRRTARIRDTVASQNWSRYFLMSFPELRLIGGFPEPRPAITLLPTFGDSASALIAKVFTTGASLS